MRNFTTFDNWYWHLGWEKLGSQLESCPLEEESACELESKFTARGLGFWHEVGLILSF